MCVYRICFPNGKQYVGIATNPETRKKQHLSENGKQLVSRAIAKHGAENCHFEVLFADVEPETAAHIEQELIREWNLQDRCAGYNVSSGGEVSSAGVRWSDERRRAWSERCKGRTISPEARQKISDANKISAKGRIIPEEQRRKIAETLRGRKIGPPSEETRQKLSAANTGKVRTAEARQRVSAAQDHKKRPLLGTHLDTLECVHFDSIHEAARTLGLSKGNINKQLRGVQQRVGRWTFAHASYDVGGR
jgi:group I intron endonuclease